jgi:DNA-binding transcriptional LysR family regulator
MIQDKFEDPDQRRRSSIVAREVGSLELRPSLVQCYLRSHRPDEADAESQVLLGFYSASREVWQHWYEEQKRAGPGGGAAVVNGGP